MSGPVVVAGAGPAGAVAALALARAGHTVIVLDAGLRSPRVGETLPPAALPMLRDLGLLDSFRRQRHLPSAGSLSAWGSPVLAAVDAIVDPHGPGWQLDRCLFDALLLDAARAAGARVIDAGVLCSARRIDSHGWRIRLASGSELRCSWLVDATGRRRTLARLCGGRLHRLDRLVAFQAHLHPREGDTATDEETRTLVEAVRDGWWYTSRAPSGGRVVAFLTDGDLADAAEFLSVEGFRGRLARTGHIRSAIDSGAWLERPRGGDASTARLERVTGEGWIAVGDAALSFDPLSSQGVFNAMYTGLKGGQAVGAAIAGDLHLLTDYRERLRTIHAAYLAHRRSYYALERRWAAEPFWRRRTRHLAGTRRTAALPPVAHAAGSGIRP